MKKIIAFISLLFILVNSAYAAGTDSSNEVVKPSSYTSILKMIKEEKYEDSIKALEDILKKSKYQKDPDILTHYAFALRKTKNFSKAEEYYLKALSIDSKHKGALEYIGELYVDTNRLELANQTLKKLENCRCSEYAELKNYINK